MSGNRSRRTVLTSPLVRRAGKRSGRLRLWAYGYADLALLFGMSEGAVRTAAYEGRFDPASLASIFEYAARLREKAGRKTARLLHREKP